MNIRRFDVVSIDKNVTRSVKLGSAVGYVGKYNLGCHVSCVRTINNKLKRQYSLLSEHYRMLRRWRLESFLGEQ